MNYFKLLYQQSLTLLVFIVLLSGSVAARPQKHSVQVAQQLETISQNETRIKAERLLNEGVQLLEQRTIPSQLRAIEKWEEARSLWRTVGDKSQEALVLLRLGSVYKELGATTPALERYNQALTLYRELGNRLQAAFTLGEIGGIYVADLEQWDDAALFKLERGLAIISDRSRSVLNKRDSHRKKAREFYSQSLATYQEINNSSEVDSLAALGEARILNRMAQSNYLHNDEEEKEKLFERSLAIYQKLGERWGEALVLGNLSALYLTPEYGEAQKGWEFFERAIAIYQELNKSPDSRNFATRQAEATLLNMAVRYLWSENQQKALQFHDRSLNIYREIGDFQGEALTLKNLGDRYSISKNRPKELELYNRALSIYQTIGDRLGEATVLDRLGSIYSDLEDNSKALEFWHRELETLKAVSQFYAQLGDSEKSLDFAYDRATVLLKIGEVYHQLSDRKKELAAYDRARTIYRTWGDRQGETNFLIAIAERYGSRDDREGTIAFLNRAIAVYREIGDRLKEAALLRNKIAPVYFYRFKDPEKGFDALNRALIIYREIDVNEVSQQQVRTEEARTLSKIGYFYLNILENKEKALEFYNRVVPIYQELDNSGEEVYTLRTIGKIYYELENYERALTAFNRAVRVYRKKGNRQETVKIIREIAEDYSQLGDKGKAVEFYRQAIPIYRELEDYKKEASTLRTIGQLYYELETPDKAVETFNLAARVYRENGDRAGEAWTLYRTGKSYTTLGDLEKALDVYYRALPLYERELKVPFREERTLDILISMGQIYSYLEEPEKALKFCDRSLASALEFPESKLVRRSEIFRRIGKLCYQMGASETALESFNNYGNIYQKLGSDRQAVGLVRIGEDYSELGDPAMALNFFNRARTVYQKSNFSEGEITTLRRIGWIYSYLKNQQKSLDFFNQALTISREINARNRTATILSDLGTVYSELGDRENALKFYNQSLKIYQEIGDIRNQTDILNKIGQLYKQLGELEKALEIYHQALKTSQENGFIELGSTPRDIGQLYHQLGELEKALHFFQQTLNVRGGSFGIYTDLGKLYSDLGDWSNALEFFNKSLMLPNSSTENKAENLFGIALIERKLGNLDKALTQMEAAISLIEEERASKNSPEARQDFFASKQDYYEFYIDLLMELHQQDPSKGYDARAITINERSRARSLLELLAEADTDIRKGVAPELVIQERSLQQQLDAVEQRRVKLYKSDYNLEQKTAIEREREYLLQNYRKVQTKIRETSPGYAALTQPQPLTLKEIQQKILDDRTILLQYSLGKQRSFLWAVTKDSITSYELPPRELIEKTVKRFRRTVINRRTSPNRLLQASESLYQMILAPAASQLGDRRLAIVADGILHYLPFTALSIPTTATSEAYTPLVAKHEIVNLPSASTLAILRRGSQQREPAPKTIAIIADPVFSSEDTRLETSTDTPRENWEKYILNRAAQQIDIGIWDRLPGTRTEAEAILALVPRSQSSYAFDFGANRAAATNPQLNQYQILHFATHGLLNSINPELSGIVLSMVDEKGNSQNGFLRLHDVFNLDIAADLVVLSACKTGLGKQVRGEGLVGLTRGFMYAGAPRVLVSLWNVDDAGTAEMMSIFYRLLLTEKLSPTEALRAAQKEMQADSRWASPYYWAGFTLQGEWR